MKKKKIINAPLLYSTPILICITIFMFAPFILTTLISLTNFTLQNIGSGRGVRIVGLRNYFTIWDDGRLLTTIMRTMVWMIGCVVGGIIVGCIEAVVMNFDIKGKSFIKAVILMPWVLPEIITGFIWKQMFVSETGIIWCFLENLGLVSSDSAVLSNPKIAMLLVVIANTWRAGPYVAIMVYGKIKSLPQSQVDAARIDGANTIQLFWYITLRWIWPIVKRCALLLCIWSFNAYGIIYAMTNGGPGVATTTLPIAMRTTAFGTYSFGKGAAYGVVILAILILLLLFMKEGLKAIEIIRKKKRKCV